MSDVGIQKVSMMALDKPSTPSLSFDVNPVGQNAFLAGIEGLNSTISVAESNMTSYLLDNNSVSVHELMISVEKAQESMKIAVELRNKISESYKEILNMQI